jgi:hypothetical protein
MRPSTIFVAASAAALVSSASLAQNANDRVSFEPFFEAGQSMRYVLDLDATIKQKEGEQRAFNQRVDQTITLDFEVVAVDDRGAVIDAKIIGLNLGAMWGDRMYAYEWPRLTTDVPLRLPPIVILEKMGEATRDARVKVRVDRSVDGEPGRVVVSGFEDIAETLEGQDVFDMTVLGLLANEQIADALTGAFFVEGASGKQIRKGAGWQTEDRVNLGPAGAMDIATSWVFASLEQGVATVRGTPRATIARPASADPASPSARLEAQESSIEVKWNVDLGRADSRVSKQAMTTVWTLGPLTLSQEQDTTLSVTRKN